MAKVALVVLAGTETHSDLGRLTNALEFATEAAEEGDELELIFDAGGTQWIPELEDDSHPAHGLYETLLDHISVCDYCADAFHVSDEVDAAPVERVAEYDRHPSLRSLVADGYEVVTF